ncbi:hypothetical protein N0V93_004736 [Gnomoniopsis smithogilvyi]|uniref:Uncharacterized protein n=1 Tax=Gnomoniopsis smithogilvyi TaxID=1191159 RepID=A0A9W8YRK8_9PEZI|nr:hypothetical protein N0V93_004736 [Gnomoniopsis smithogilvyi]
MADKTTADEVAGAPFPMPRVTIKFCTQCKWNLRAAYFAQELLSTFSTSLGEVALQPSTGGTFIVEIFHQPSHPSTSSSSSPPLPSHPSIQATILWDRTKDGGFPETKELKRRVRDVIEPGRNLGHVDRDHARPGAAAGSKGEGESEGANKALPSRAELEAAGQAGGGYPGSNEAAAVLVDDLQSSSKKEACEDCT